MSLIKIGHELAIDWDLVYAVRFMPREEDIGIATGIWIYADLPGVHIGEPCAKIDKKADIEKIRSKISKTIAEKGLKDISTSFYVDISKIVQVVVKDNSGLVTFGFPLNRFATISIDTDTAFALIKFAEIS